MQIGSQNLNNFNFSFKTSSGDQISLSMYDNKSFDYKQNSSKNGTISELSLRHQYGYHFEYSGNGLDENDIKELKDALKTVDKTFNQFLQNVKNGENFSKMDMTNMANGLKSNLPTIKNLDHKNLISDKILEIFDQNLLKQGTNSDILKLSNELYEKILQSLENFSIYV